MYSLLLFLFISHPTLAATAARCHRDDETGLLGFKAGINSDPSGILSTWKAGTDCCTWDTVSCRNGDRVTTISLYVPDNSSLTGTISQSLGKLQYLDGIYLHNLKHLTGPFPAFLFQLPRIQFVYIENCQLSGQIPVNIGKIVQLEALSLEGNRFSGTIPSSIGDLIHLIQLKLGDNLLTGTIPSTIQQLKNLTLLHLQSNRLSGPVPDFFTSFSNLRSIILSHNNLVGGIPGTISALAPNLAYLELGHNSLSGKIPDFLSKFQSLDTLDLSWNRFSGVVPKTFVNLTKIFNLRLSHNLLVDPFPELKVRGIESLDLSHNSFHLKTIPQWVTSSPIIYSLNLAKCGLKFRLDDWKPTKTYFYDYIDLSENEITGSPVRILNRTDYLVGFYASGNKLSFDLERMRIVGTLKSLDLSRNSVYGKVPKEVAGLTKLNVSYNRLCGRLPPTKFSASSFAGNACLCGSPLPPCK